MTTFDSTKTELGKLLDEVVEGKIQLPDFQRGWVWDDEHIRSLLVSIARSFPIGAVMLLESGGDTRFQVRPVEGVSLAKNNKPDRLILAPYLFDTGPQAVRARNHSRREKT
jgi:uncharacterized protein with ParB-like and HNH nuclease domain